MSFKRKQRDNKLNNPVAKHDHNVGGFHGKSYKAKRTNVKAHLSQIDLENEGEWETLEEEWGYVQ